MSVYDSLQLWKAAHTAALTARRNRNLDLNREKLEEAQQALLDAAGQDPTLSDTAWATIPPLKALQTFYTQQFDTSRPLAPRFVQLTPQGEQTALVEMQASQAQMTPKAPHA